MILLVGCSCFMTIGSAAGVFGIVMHINSPSAQSVAAGVTLLWASAAFLIIGAVFAVLDRFMKDPKVSAKAKAKVVEGLTKKIPDAGSLLRLSQPPKHGGDTRGPDLKGDDSV